MIFGFGPEVLKFHECLALSGLRASHSDADPMFIASSATGVDGVYLSFSVARAGGLVFKHTAKIMALHCGIYNAGCRRLAPN